MSFSSYSGLVISVIIVLLAREKELQLYVHPRFIVFSVLMCTFYGLSFVLSAKNSLEKVRQEHNSNSLSKIASLLLVALLVCAGAILSPSSLSSQTALTRGINSASFDSSELEFSNLQRFTNSSSHLDIKEWASLLSSINDPDFFVGKTARVVGFIAPHEDKKELFYASRFVLACCAVDVRPLGVPVLSDDWQDTYAVDAWVEVEGVFINHNQHTVLQPVSITIVPEPENPYVY
jgi:putative membrane protein